MKRAIVVVAEGCEEMEAVISIDIMRRAGWIVDVAGLHTGNVRCSRDVVLVPDAEWNDLVLDSYDLILLPGGMEGMENLRRDERVLQAVREFDADGRIVAAICAAPLALQEAGLLEGRKATCHPGVAEQLTVIERDASRVVVDGNIVTSQGPGTAMEFALKLIELLEGEKAARAIAGGLVL